jgi:serine O-acetyltransferase
MTESIHSKIIKKLILLEYNYKIFKFLRKIINEAIYHVEISPTSFKNIENIKTLRMPHPYNIIIHGKSIIGKNVTIFHNVTIGVIEKSSAPLPPKIEDNVYIGAGSLILGEIVLHENCKIGAGSIVLKSVESGKTIIGICK